MIIEQFVAGFLGASVIEMMASISGFICVLLLIRRNIWNFAFGFIQVTLFVWVFYQAKLYSDTMLHIIYMGLQIYGWWNWTHNKSQQTEPLIERGSVVNIGLWLAISAVGTLSLGYYMDNYTNASFAYGDAFTTSTSLLAMWLMTRRQLFNWVLWIVVDIVATVIYFQKGLYPTTVLYGVFLILSGVGLYTWHKSYKEQQVSIE
jgi:nicotinamide mononucleotide transporter